MSDIKKYGVLLDLVEHKNFMATLKSEVDKANKRLKRMNDFQKGVFEDKGITHISRRGSLEDKMRALSQARIVNESGISTKAEYNHYVSKLSSDLSLSKKEVDYMLNQFDSRTRDFISKSPLKFGSNPQIDFMFEDVMQVNDILEHNIEEMESYLNNTDSLAGEIFNIVYGL